MLVLSVYIQEILKLVLVNTSILFVGINVVSLIITCSAQLSQYWHLGVDLNVLNIHSGFAC